MLIQKFRGRTATRRRRIAYLSGPVDAVEAYYAWKNGWILKYFGDSHILAFIELCHEMDANFYIVTTLAKERNKYIIDNNIINNIPTTERSGMLFHIDYIWWSIRNLPYIIFFKPDVVILTAGINYSFCFSFLRLFGIKILPVSTAVLWPKFAKIDRIHKKILITLNGLFFRYFVDSAITVSNYVAKQIYELKRGDPNLIYVFLPFYDRSRFSGFTTKSFEIRPFCVLFSGRIDENKGVFDLVEIIDRLCQNNFKNFHFNICGDGTLLDTLRKQIEERGLSEMVTCHGFCDRIKLSLFMQDAHVVIVPTRTEEGFNMVCAESILAGRPVITSAVCPALEYVKDAAIEVEPNDLNSYYEALVKISSDKKMYEDKVFACKTAQSQFYNVETSFKSILRKALSTPASRNHSAG